RYRQQDAVLYGTEVMLKYQPALFKGLRISASYEALVGKLIGGEYLPYMPARKLKPEVRYEREFDRQVSGYAFMNNEFVFTQNLVNPLEQETPAYQLFNAGAGVTLHHHKTGYQIYVTANNLLNEAYFDHLSRLKTFGLFNIGRDISIHIKIKLFNNLKQNKNEKTN
ncbi:MAG: TonB-dependent receptor, partial [Bacteroidales bacterium]|nr:TonB-dependent receptor [Bacteroidales bacterium]